MATTTIHAITQTIGKSIDYITSDKVETILKDDISDAIQYAMNDKTGEITYTTLSTAINCANQTNPVEDFRTQMECFGMDEIKNGNSKTKDGKPILGWHLVQSFDEEEIDPITAHEIGIKLAEQVFGNFPVVVSTHTNTDNIHNHFIICAWDFDGKKWDNSNRNYKNLIRATSDRLCDEYGLSVLEHTRNQRLVRWYDEEGNLHYYEPTDRKNEMIRKREAGELTTDDVNSYRNTFSYEIKEAQKKSNVEQVKQAIDELLPYATSYEHLLFMMRDLGFEVKDKKKNGEWLAHITFTPPTAEKGVRDSSIDKETGYYCRENLTKIIDDQKEQKERAESFGQGIAYYETYTYGEVDIDRLNEDWRAEKDADGNIVYVERGGVEKDVVIDIKKSHEEVNLGFNTERMQQLIKANKAEKNPQEYYARRQIYFKERIKENFENLKFIEKEQLYSYDQINSIVKNLWEQHNVCLSSSTKAKEMIQKLEYFSVAPDLAKECTARIEQNKNDTVYMMERYQEDTKILKSALAVMKKYDLTSPEKIDALKQKVDEWKEKNKSNEQMLEVLSEKIAQYNQCMTVLNSIDRKYGNENKDVIRQFRQITKEAEKEARELEKNAEEKEQTEERDSKNKGGSGKKGGNKNSGWDNR